MRPNAVDIDGTRLNSEFHIAQANLEGLKRAHDLGIEIVLVTGRRHTFSLPIAEMLGFDVSLISSNGAVTRSLTGQLFNRDLLPVATARELCNMMLKYSGNTVA